MKLDAHVQSDDHGLTSRGPVVLVGPPLSRLPVIGARAAAAATSGGVTCE
jgi:hypothetical protein